MRGVRERKKSGYVVFENSALPSPTPFTACSQLALLPGGFGCGLASACQQNFELATPIRSGPRTQYAQHPTPMLAGKLIQREYGELSSCKDELGVLGEAPSHRREIVRLATSVSDSGNSRGNSEGTVWFPRGPGVHSPCNANG